jgi:hypothetical protein
MKNGLIGAAIAGVTLVGAYAAFTPSNSSIPETQDSSLLNLGMGSGYSGGDKDCADFNSQASAQAFFEANDPTNDPHHLDKDKDGRVCESLR